MPQAKLNDHQKARVIELVEAGKATQQEIAAYFNVSPRTITRVLDEHGMIHTRRTLSDKEQDFLALMRETSLSVPEVRERLSQPVLTASTLVQAVANMDETQLGGFLMSVAKYRLVREHQLQEARKAQARASNGEMQQEALYG